MNDAVDNLTISINIELSPEKFLMLYDRFQLLRTATFELGELITGGGGTSVIRYINLTHGQLALYVATFAITISFTEMGGDQYIIKYTIPDELFKWESVDYSGAVFKDEDVIDFIMKYGQDLIEL